MATTRKRKSHTCKNSQPKRSAAEKKSPSNHGVLSMEAPANVARVSLSPKVAVDYEDDDDDDSIVSSPFETLPDDVMAKCLFSGYLDSIDIIARVSCVSQRTRNVAQDTVKMLDLRRCTKLKVSHVGNLVSRFGNLSVLDFSYCTQFAGRHLMAIAPVARTLRTLFLRGTGVTDADLVRFFTAVEQGSTTCPLQQLDLGVVCKKRSANIGDRALEKIVSCCPDLECLNLAWCTNISDAGVDELAKLPKLCELDLSLCEGVTSDSCVTLVEMTSLHTLDVSATEVDDEGIRILLGEYPEEDSLDREEDDDDNQKTSEFRSPLQVLKTRFNPDLCVETLELLATRAPNLKTLDLSFCESLSRKSTIDVYRNIKGNGTHIIDKFYESDNVVII